MARKPAAAKSPKLKVFRTAIGFHDAYVAAPSRKAALAAWGSDADLFARGVAEEVTDPTLMAPALAKPGEVVRTSRGTAEEYFAALPKAKPRAAAPDPPRKAKPRPPPSRAKLDAAEAAIETADKQFRDEVAALKERERALAAERRAANDRHDAAMTTLVERRDAARAAYDEALARSTS